MNRKKSHKNGGAGVWWDSGIVKKKVIYVNGNYMGEEQQSNQYSKTPQQATGHQACSTAELRGI